MVVIRAVLFDAGDVLYSKPNRKAAIRDFLTGHGHPAPADDDPEVKAKRLQAHAGTISSEAFFAWFLRHHGVSDAGETAEGIALLRREQGEVRFFPGVADTLHALKGRGFRLGVVTNTFNPRQEKDRWFGTVGIADIWDSYADSAELGIVKPDPRIYLAALAPLGLAPRQAAFVGHAQVELDGAQALGMTTIRFNPDPDCTKADHTIATFPDLLSVPPLAGTPTQRAATSR